MNYRHGFHAGNFADVVKHVFLISLIHSLAQKQSGFCYLDTHAGAGFYDLGAEFATKTKEYVNGIEKIIRQDNPPKVIQHYLNAVHNINNRLAHAKFASLEFYPGSPLLAREFLRPQDRLVLCELHPEEYQKLKQTFLGDKQVAVHHQDGFLGLKAFLPPKEKRGLILIDPPYERPDEFQQIVNSLSTAFQRFANGVYAIWYPIKEKKQLDHFYRSLRQRIPGPIFNIELTIYPDLPNHLNGTGLVIINPPWQFDLTVQHTLPWLWKSLTINNQGYYRAEALK